jgi:hypothetical protein
MTVSTCYFCKQAYEERLVLCANEMSVCDPCAHSYTDNPGAAKPLSISECCFILGLSSDEELTFSTVRDTYHVSRYKLKEQEKTAGPVARTRRYLNGEAFGFLHTWFGEAQGTDRGRPNNPDDHARVPLRPLPNAGSGAIALSLPEPKEEKET